MLQPALADVVGPPVVGLFTVGFDALFVTRVDAPHVADDMTKQIAMGIHAEQPGLHVHAGKQVAPGHEPRDFLVCQLGADRHTLEELAALAEFAEAAAIVVIDLHDLAETVDGVVDVIDARGIDLERIGGKVARQHLALAIDDGAPVGRDRHHRDPVVLGARVIVVVAHHFQIEEARRQQAQADEDESAGHDRPLTNLPDFFVLGSEFGHFTSTRPAQGRMTPLRGGKTGVSRTQWAWGPSARPLGRPKGARRPLGGQRTR